MLKQCLTDITQMRMEKDNEIEEKRWNSETPGGIASLCILPSVPFWLLHCSSIHQVNKNVKKKQFK